MTSNPDIVFSSGQETVYTTYYGNKIHFVIWASDTQANASFGARILNIEYGSGDPADTLAGSSNFADQSQFLTGTVLESIGDPVVEIRNPFLKQQITLDWGDKWHPIRTSESGEVEQAGNGYEVWVDFAWAGPSEGDFFRPFKTIAAAADAVADQGVIIIVPGTTSERPSIPNGKQVRLVAPFGRVQIGAR